LPYSENPYHLLSNSHDTNTFAAHGQNTNGKIPYRENRHRYHPNPDDAHGEQSRAGNAYRYQPGCYECYGEKSTRNKNAKRDYACCLIANRNDAARVAHFPARMIKAQVDGE
jgi:hypothetical protein